MSKEDDRNLARHCPTRWAWAPADKAADALPASHSMSQHIDAWVGAYLKAGGQLPRDPRKAGS